MSRGAHAVARKQAPPPARAGSPDAEREADRAGEAVASRAPLARWSFAAVPPTGPAREAPDDPRTAAAVAGPGRPLDAAVRRDFELRLGAGLSGVRVHDDPAAAAATRALGTAGLAFGEDVALATRTDRALLGHELAHVVQQRAGSPLVQLQGGGAVAPATTLDALPEADRKAIQVVTTSVTVPGVAEKFATTGTKVTSAFPSGVTAEFDAGVDAALQHGLQNVAGSLSAGAELQPAPLRPNSTMTIALDPPVVGRGLYRFTYHAPSAPAGSKAAAPAPRILIEALGKYTQSAGTKAPPPPATPGAPAAPDPVAEKIKKHSIKQSYSGTELDALRAAIDQIPDAQLSLVDGLAFDRAPADQTDPKVGGHYDQEKHTVTMFDRAFAVSATAYKAGGTTASTEATREIVHEIGHAIDLESMRKAGAERNKALAGVEALVQEYPDPDKAGSYRYEKGTEAEKVVKGREKALKDAEDKLLKTKSVSGTGAARDATGAVTQVIGTSTAGNKFREALVKDAGKAVTKYGDQDFQESFAEAYSLYITSPDTLKALRPNVFDFLDKTLPK